MACSGVTSASSARVRPRNGPPLAVSTSRRTSSARPPTRHWARAECSESTGTICPGAAAAVTSGPPMISDSLLARARLCPARSAARVGASPTAPVIPLRTTSQARPASSVAASGPARTSGREPPGRSAASAASSAGAAAASATATTGTSNADRLFGQQGDVPAAGGQPDHAEPTRVAHDDVEGLGADRARAAQEDDVPARGHGAIVADQQRHGHPCHADAYRHQRDRVHRAAHHRHRRRRAESSESKRLVRLRGWRPPDRVHENRVRDRNPERCNQHPSRPARPPAAGRRRGLRVSPARPADPRPTARAEPAPGRPALRRGRAHPGVPRRLPGRDRGAAQAAPANVRSRRGGPGPRALAALRRRQLLLAAADQLPAGQRRAAQPGERPPHHRRGVPHRRGRPAHPRRQDRRAPGGVRPVAGPRVRAARGRHGAAVHGQPAEAGGVLRVAAAASRWSHRRCPARSARSGWRPGSSCPAAWSPTSTSWRASSATAGTPTCRRTTPPWPPRPGPGTPAASSSPRT